MAPATVSSSGRAGRRNRNSLGVLLDWFALKKIEGIPGLDGVYAPFTRETHLFFHL